MVQVADGVGGELNVSQVFQGTEKSGRNMMQVIELHVEALQLFQPHQTFVVGLHLQRGPILVMRVDLE